MTSPLPGALTPSRTIKELKELRALTGDANGAQRVAFTPTWDIARRWFIAKLKALPVEVHTDAAGNLWATLSGADERALLIGGHIDSVPNGGWLDGCLNLTAGLEVLRRIASQGMPPVTVRLVDWADEEGARFGRSLFGSSAAAGTLRPDELRHLSDRDGVKLFDAVAQYGVDVDRAPEARAEIQNAAAYLELHIEQGPVLEHLGLPMGPVLGTFGVERHAVTFIGQAAHSGSTPMSQRRDALGGVSKLHLAIREIAVRNGGVGTVGKVVTRPGIVTAVAGQAEMTIDLRHLDVNKLATMFTEVRQAADRIAAEERIQVAWKRTWEIPPIPFHPDLIAMADEAIVEICGSSHRMPSGPLHDAAEMARAGVPTVMLFVQSLRGISHDKTEDTKEEHLELAVRALDRLADKAMRWICQT